MMFLVLSNENMKMKTDPAYKMMEDNRACYVASEKFLYLLFNTTSIVLYMVLHSLHDHEMLKKMNHSNCVTMPAKIHEPN